MARRDGLRHLRISTDLEALLVLHPGEEIPIAAVLYGLSYRTHALLIFILSLPFVVPMPLLGASTIFGLVMMFSALSIMSGLNPWIPARLREKKLSRATLQKLIFRADKMTPYLEKWVRPRWLSFSTSPFFLKLHALMIFIAAGVLAVPLPPGGNILPGVATMILALGLVEEDGLILALGYVLTLINVLLLVLILVYGVEWIRSLL